jgi:RNA polymerase sigma-70 factor (ECF subfamily)
MTELQDDVIANARAGDKEALGRLWTAHQPSILRFLRGMGCRSPEDVSSNVWIDVARGLGRFSGDATDFRRWLFTIARRRCIDEVRRSVRYPEQLSSGAGLDRAADDTAEVYDRSMSLDRAIELVRSLPADAAEVLLLRVVADLDVAEVAVLVGKSEGNVRVIMHRAVTRLARGSAVTNVTDPAMNSVP